MADSLREEIRACIREELQRSAGSPINNQSLVERTRSLIEASASSASETLSSATNERPRNTNKPKVGPYNKRPVPGHPLRFTGKKVKQTESKKATPQIVPKTVYLIDEVDCANAEGDYSLTESMILIKGECDLNSTYSEDNIRSELIDLFKAKLPLIQKKDFDFVRRERNSITTPLVKAGHQWDFKHVKHLCGQGKLYVRLNVSKDILVGGEETEEEDSFEDKPGEESCGEPKKEKAVSNVGPMPPVIHVSDDQDPSTSAGSSFFDESLASLTEIFPEEDPDIARDTLIRYEDLELAAEALSEKAGVMSSEAESGNESVAEVLKRLKSGMEGYGSAEKLKVDEEDLAVDFFQ